MSDVQRTTIKYTNQEVFNLVAFHLFTQGQRSMNHKGSCLYRGPNNLKCAIGALIPDSIYSENIEGARISTLVLHLSRKYSPEIANLFQGVNTELLSSLQDVHDLKVNWYSTRQMKLTLRFIGEYYHLNTSILNNLSFADGR